MSASTSGTYAYSPAVITLLNRALRIAQVIGAEETATGAQLANALEAMTAMCKAWQGSGIHVWSEEEAILFLQPEQILYYIGAGSTDHATLWNTLNQTTLTANAAVAATVLQVESISGMLAGDNIGIQLDAGTNFWTTVQLFPTATSVQITTGLPSQATSGQLVFDYTTPLSRPLRVYGGRRYNYVSGIDTPMQKWARLDYQSQPNKMTTGTPTAFFYDPQTGQGQYSQASARGQWNQWPNPSDYTNGARFTAQRPLQDIGTLANVPDFPVEWNAAITWNLALEVGPENGTPKDQLEIIVAQAQRWYNMAKEWDREPESVRFGVATRPSQQRGG